MFGRDLVTLGDSFINKYTQAGLTGREIEQNQFNAQQAQESRDWSSNENALTRQFNADEAEKARQFNAEQAQINRDWQTQMDNTRYQRATEDMQAAGLNPAMMYGSGMGPSTAPSGAAASASPASSSPASGASASGSIGAGGSMSELLELLFSTEQYRNLKLTNDNLQKDLDVKDSEIALNESNLPLIEQNLRNAQSQGVLFADEHEIRLAELFYLQVRNASAEQMTQLNVEFQILNNKLTRAKTAHEEQAAHLTFLQAAYQQGLLNSGYIESLVKQLESQSRVNYSQAEINDANAQIQKFFAEHQSESFLNEQELVKSQTAANASQKSLNDYNSRTIFDERTPAGRLANKVLRLAGHASTDFMHLGMGLGGVTEGIGGLFGKVAKKIGFKTGSRK